MRNIWLLLALIGAVSISTFTSAKSVYQTSDITLLDNRFRVDHGIDKITFIIARERFSKAVILVRPDGSKVYIWDKSDRVHWIEGEENDIITIDQPMAGPWQAIGKIQGNNRIQLLSDVKLQVNRLPIQLYSGERLKVSGELLHLEERLNESYLRDAELIMTAYGYNRTEDENFNFTSQELARFNDKGVFYDELPEDGLFTAFLQLDLDTGKYKFEVAVKNHAFTRSFNQDVILFPKPIKTQMLSLLEGEDPQLKLTYDIAELKPESIVIKGRLLAVNSGESSDFIIYGEADMAEQIHTFQRPDETGNYSIDLMLFATTKAGREIIMKLPAEAFVIPKPIFIDSALIPAATVSQAETTETSMTLLEDTESDWNLVLWVVGSLLALLVLAVTALFTIKFWQKRKFEKVISNQMDGEITAPMPLGRGDELNKMTNLDLNSLDK
ncbi:TIGR03503 family protein [Moritella sp. Urea-trap-13]|uniref:TIGR03503 family protein n=1 Tax=Moritella sp. Urea-trap-13 TaxID=2058327 RepID=UPI000C330150|nr:TIGR03503 family protein [Moritella sp. Urea-trap-13]PKH04626.1 TIGR03503 family protein [Moritella sp. Urea-trap-13]